MAVKRKHRKFNFNPVVRGHAVRLKAAEGTASARDNQRPNVSNDLIEAATHTESHAHWVMLVITVLGLGYLAFIAWCVAQMPAA